VITALLAGCGLPTRTLTVHAAADEEFRAQPQWRQLIASRLKAISDLYQANFRIRWRLARVSEWASGDGSRDADALEEQLRSQLQRQGADILLGFTAQQIRGHELGSVNPFGDTVLVRAFPDRSEQENVAILAHELAHLFGVPHAKAAGSVMHAAPSRLEFDSYSIRLIQLLSGLDFSRGARAIDASLARKMADILAEGDSEAGAGPRAYLYVGSLFRSQSQPATAVALFESAVRMSPHDAPARLLLALALKECAREEAALEHLREAVRLDPGLVEARVNLGILLAAGGREREGLAELRAAVEIAPGNAGARYNLGAALLRRLGGLDMAIEQFREALRLQPDHAAAAQALYLATRKQEELRLAAAKWREAVRRNPKDAAAHFNLGVACSDLGRHAEAVAAYRSALRLDPRHLRALSNLAVTHYTLGNYQAARQAAQRLTALGGAPRPGFLEALAAAETSSQPRAHRK
jgi:tetratricopeptide (TPR) repeat protein